MPSSRAPACESEFEFESKSESESKSELRGYCGLPWYQRGIRVVSVGVSFGLDSTHPTAPDATSNNRANTAAGMSVNISRSSHVSGLPVGDPSSVQYPARSFWWRDNT